jgi:hypothetical protein
MRDLDGEVASEFMLSIIGSDPCDFLTAIRCRARFAGDLTAT